MREVVAFAGVMIFFLGIAMADTENLLLPVGLMAAGLGIAGLSQIRVQVRVYRERMW